MPFTSSAPLRSANVWLMLMVSAVGCGESGPQLAPVSGRVTLDGDPLAVAEITFQPDAGAAGSASYGRTDPSGRYELLYSRKKKGALVGPHTVRIRAATELTGPGGESIVRAQLVPPHYNAESELRRDIEPDGENTFNFELTSEAN